MEFKERLEQIRRQKGLNQDELAELVGVSPSTFRRWEWGKHEPKVTELLKLSAALGVSVSELVGEAPDKITLRRGPLSVDIPATPEGLALLERTLSEFTAGEKSPVESSKAG